MQVLLIKLQCVTIGALVTAGGRHSRALLSTSGYTG